MFCLPPSSTSCLIQFVWAEYMTFTSQAAGCLRTLPLMAKPKVSRGCPLNTNTQLDRRGLCPRCHLRPYQVSPSKRCTGSKCVGADLCSLDPPEWQTMNAVHPVLEVLRLQAVHYTQTLSSALVTRQV